LQDPVKAGHDPLGILIFIIVIIIFLIRRVLLGPPIMPRLGPTLLERLPLEVLPLLLLPLCIMRVLTLFSDTNQGSQ
jgi:hypothetical protein